MTNRANWLSASWSPEPRAQHQVMRILCHCMNNCGNDTSPSYSGNFERRLHRVITGHHHLNIPFLNFCFFSPAQKTCKAFLANVAHRLSHSEFLKHLELHPRCEALFRILPDGHRITARPYPRHHRTAGEHPCRHPRAHAAVDTSEDAGHK